MNLKFWDKPGDGPWELAPELRDALVNQFNFAPEDTERLRYVRKEGILPGSPMHVRIYDPERLSVNTSVDGYNSLDPVAHVIMFEGQIDKDKAVTLRDVRTPTSSARAA
ncbi:MAG: hypothetical protein ACOC5K_00145 [Chloroflexota bacterium]